jgi:hypothetical protein
MCGLVTPQRGSQTEVPPVRAKKLDLDHAILKCVMK